MRNKCKPKGKLLSNDVPFPAAVKPRGASPASRRHTLTEIDQMLCQFSSTLSFLRSTKWYTTVRVVHSITRNMSDKPKVYVTRRVPSRGIELLKPHCTITQWDDDSVVPRDILIQNVARVDALFCLLTDKIDDEVLNAGIVLSRA